MSPADLRSTTHAGFYCAPYPADQAERYAADEAKRQPQPCIECGDLTMRTKGGERVCVECSPCCSDEDGPCDRHNPYLGNW